MTATLDYVRALYEYNEWANGHVVDAAARLSGDELSRELGASFGSVAGNLMHTLGAQNLWLSRWTKTPLPPGLPPGVGFEGLRGGFSATDGSLCDLAASLDEEQLDAPFDYVDTQGNPQSRVLWQAMLHLVNHGTHHRAETALLLTALGKPPRQLDYLFFELERAGGAPRLT